LNTPMPSPNRYVGHLKSWRAATWSGERHG
jgi:hypothetical protein